MKIISKHDMTEMKDARGVLETIRGNALPDVDALISACRVGKVPNVTGDRRTTRERAALGLLRAIRRMANHEDSVTCLGDNLYERVNGMIENLERHLNTKGGK